MVIHYSPTKERIEISLEKCVTASTIAHCNFSLRLSTTLINDQNCLRCIPIFPILGSIAFGRPNQNRNRRWPIFIFSFPVCVRRWLCNNFANNWNGRPTTVPAPLFVWQIFLQCHAIAISYTHALATAATGRGNGGDFKTIMLCPGPTYIRAAS